MRKFFRRLFHRRYACKVLLGPYDFFAQFPWRTPLRLHRLLLGNIEPSEVICYTVTMTQPHTHKSSDFGTATFGCGCPNPEASEPSWVRTSKGHTHLNEQGRFVRCYHKSRAAVLSMGFWVGLTIGFPFEHALWEHVWPLTIVTEWLHHFHW